MKQELKVDLIVGLITVLMEALWLLGVMLVIHYLCTAQWERWIMGTVAIVMIARRWKRILRIGVKA